MENFFSHENQASPPSISEYGKLRFEVKSDLLKCLEIVSDAECNDTSSCRPAYDMIAVDGAVLVQMLKPGNAKTFTAYANDVFKPYIMSELSHVKRLDIIWDSYNDNSLKEMTRFKRGFGMRVHVSHLDQYHTSGKNFFV